MKHRRAQIIDALAELFEQLKEPSEFPLKLQTIQKRYPNWTTLEHQKALPCLMLNFGGFRKRDGGANTEFASLGETEEILLITLDVVLKESAETPKALTDQVSDSIYTVERLINGTPDLDVEGVCRARVVEMDTSQGKATALIGTPFEVLRFSVNVTHVYRSNTSV